MSCLKIKDLSFSYETNEVLKDINLEIDNGVTVALLGANGCGKTTLFKCILNLLTPKGEIYINDREIKEYSRRELSRAISYIPQEHYPVFNYRVYEVLLTGLAPNISVFSSPSDEDYFKAVEVLDSLGISFLAHKGYKHLSGGERQIVLIARAILQGANFLIMDEPTANLDYGNQIKIMEYISKLKENGTTVLLSTHNPEHALMYCDEIVVMSENHIISHKKGDNKLSDEILSKIYDTPLMIKEIDENNNKYKVILPLNK